MRTRLKAAAISTLGASALLLGGCAGAPFGPISAPIVAAKPGLHGTVHGGQNPVQFSSIQMYAIGTSGYGSAATSILNFGVQTDMFGSFSLAGGAYTCPATTAAYPNGVPVYIVANGGAPGNSASINPQINLMAAIGPCNTTTLNASTNIVVNELTTVAAVWALSPFMAGPSNVGATSTNSTGILNAFSGVNNLITLSTGTTPGLTLPAGATLPTTEINTLADILAACVNSTGGVDNDGTNCGTLFHNAKNGSTQAAPTETITAALNIAQNPGRNVAALYALATGTPPFQFTLGAAPNDWTIAINYTGGGISAPEAIAVDASGNVWTANSGNNSATKLSNIGAAISGTSGFTGGSMNAPSGIAIDTSGNAWLSNTGGTSVTNLTANGATATNYTGGGLSAPQAITIDAAGNIWVANTGSNSITELAASSFAGTNYATAGITKPAGIAVNPQ